MKSLAALCLGTALLSATIAHAQTASSTAADLIKDAGAVGADQKVLNPTNPLPPGSSSADISTGAAEGGSIDELDASKGQLSKDTGSKIFAIEMQNRLLDAQAKQLAVRVQIAKSIADLAKSASDLKTQQQITSGTAPKSTYVDGQAPQVPTMNVRWVAGSGENLEAMVHIPKLGNFMLKVGSELPSAPQLTVYKITPSGLITTDKDGNQIPIGFSE